MSTTAASAANPRRALAQILVGNQVQQAVYVAAKLGIADLLQDGPKAISELAAAARADAKSLYRLLRVLAAFGFFVEDEQHCFVSTPLGALLEKGTASRAFALWSGGVSYQVFGSLEHSVRTGEPSFERLFGAEFFDYLSQNPEVGDLFDDLMSWHTGPVAPEVAATDFAGTRTVVDLGGGRGELLACVLNTHQSLHGVLVDRAQVVPSAKRLLEKAGVADRCSIMVGDIFTSIPQGGDVYILKSVLHGLSDTKAIRLLNRCREAMSPLGKLLIVEFVMPQGNAPFPGKLMDLLMLVGCHGQERTQEEFTRLFDAAGFRQTGLTTTRCAYSIIQAQSA
jgi:hypothetical protein